MSENNDFNTQVIEEFRANGGRVGGPFEGAPMVLVHHKGAKSGAERIVPLMYRPEGDDIAIFARERRAVLEARTYLTYRVREDLGLELNHRVTGIYSTRVGWPFLGFRIDRSGLRLRRATWRRSGSF